MNTRRTDKKTRQLIPIDRFLFPVRYSFPRKLLLRLSRTICLNKQIRLNTYHFLLFVDISDSPCRPLYLNNAMIPEHISIISFIVFVYAPTSNEYTMNPNGDTIAQIRVILMFFCHCPYIIAIGNNNNSEVNPTQAYVTTPICMVINVTTTHIGATLFCFANTKSVKERTTAKIDDTIPVLAFNM